MPAIARIVAVAALAAMTFKPAWAYVGPGAGLSMLGAFWTLLTAICAAIGFLILRPVRHFLRRLKPAGAPVQESSRVTDSATRQTRRTP